MPQRATRALSLDHPSQVAARSIIIIIIIEGLRYQGGESVWCWVWSRSWRDRCAQSCQSMRSAFTFPRQLQTPTALNKLGPTTQHCDIIGSGQQKCSITDTAISHRNDRRFEIGRSSLTVRIQCFDRSRCNNTNRTDDIIPMMIRLRSRIFEKELLTEYPIRLGKDHLSTKTTIHRQDPLLWQ